MVNYGEILEQDKYYTSSDLRYDKSLGFNFSGHEMDLFNEFKETLVEAESEEAIKTGLESFNSRYIYYFNHIELRHLYHEYVQLINSDEVFYPDSDESIRALVYSEIEGSLNIEGYNSTRKIFDELSNGRKPDNINEIVLRNLARGIDFIKTKPDFNEENLFILYSLVSEDCLDEEAVLKASQRYRDDIVYISTYCGAETNKIKPCMDSMFSYVNVCLKTSNEMLRFMLPSIVHYYMVYVHPYFDCNGRVARLCALWVAELEGKKAYSYYISEAINNSKREYYKALSRTRDSRNDLTYFLIYILNASIRISKVYYEMEIINKRINSEGEHLTPNEQIYLKRILISSNNEWFNWKDFNKYANVEMSKQGALKTLNIMESMGILKSKINKRKEKVFHVIQ